MPVKPVSPDDAENERIFPDEVIEAFNELIMKSYQNGYASVVQKEVITLIKEKMDAAGKNITRQQIVNEGYLNVEPLFRKQGWEVKRDVPGWDERYDTKYDFKKL